MTLLPLIFLVPRAMSSGFDQAWAIVVRPRTLTLMINTMSLAAVVAVGSFVLGVASAWMVARHRLPGRRVWWIAVCLPLAVPSYVAAFAWVAAFPGTRGFWPLAAILVLSCSPLVAVPTMSALAIADHAPADVARTLGRSAIRVFVTVTLPQILPAALAGTLLAALYALSDFGAPAILRYETLTTGIYGLFTGGINRSAAAATSLVLAVLALVCIVGERLLRRRTADRQRSARGLFLPAAPVGRATAALYCTFLAALVTVSVAFPLAAMILRATRGDRYRTTTNRLMEATISTMTIGAIAATLAVLAALPISYLAARYRDRVVATLESVSFLGDGLPGVVIALGLVAAFLALLPFAYQTLPMLLAAYVILFISKSIGSSRSAFGAIAPGIEEASRTLGTGPTRTFLRVTLPVALPGVVAGWMLVLVSVMKELPATLMLRPIGVETLTTELWSKTTLGAYGAAAPIGLLLVVIGILPAWLLARSAVRL